METIYIALTEAHFRELVAGRIVSVGGTPGKRSVRVEIVLSDIGFQRMKAHIDEAIVAPKPDTE